MKKTKKTSTTTFKMWHRTLALLLLILIAFSSASCNAIEEPEETNNSSESETRKAFPYTEYDPADLESFEVPAEVLVGIKERYDEQVAPLSKKSQTFFSKGELELQIHGIYGDSYAIYAKEVYGTLLWKEIEGLEFRHTVRHAPMIYTQDSFYGLEEALEKNLISRNDLQKIHASYVEQNFYPYYKHSPTERVLDGISLDDNFGEDEVYVIIQPQYVEKEYTVEDFKEVNCTNIYIKSRYGDPNEIDRVIKIILDRESKENVLEAIKVLNERDDIYQVFPVYYNEYAEVPNAAL